MQSLSPLPYAARRRGEPIPGRLTAAPNQPKELRGQAAVRRNCLSPKRQADWLIAWRRIVLMVFY